MDINSILGIAKALGGMKFGKRNDNPMGYDMNAGMPEKDMALMTPEEVKAYEIANGTADIGKYGMLLNDKTSIVDFLKSKGLDSSFRQRKELAQGFGMSGYRGTPEENMMLLEYMRNPQSVPYGPQQRAQNVSTNSTYTGDQFGRNIPQSQLIRNVAQD